MNEVTILPHIFATGQAPGVVIFAGSSEYSVGPTDLVPSRAAASDALLKARDYDVAAFVEKVERFAPKIVAFNGEKAATKVARHLKHAPLLEGPAPLTIGPSLVYRLPSSSSSNATGGYAAKRAKWVEFGEWVDAPQRP
jgi:TDG/mug DNA glycosylase family protein